MKKFIVTLGLFLISVLPAAAQFSGTYDEYVKFCWPDGVDKPMKPLCAIMAWNPTNSNTNNTGNNTTPCITNASNPTKKTANGALSDTAEEFARGSTPTTNSNPAPVTTGNPLSRLWNGFTQTIFGFRAQTTEEKNTAINSVCKTNPGGKACACIKNGFGYSEALGACIPLNF